jgi:hypothetical protein
MVRIIVLVALLAALGACSSFGQPVAEPTWASCDKAPSQQNVAERNYCSFRGRGGG